MEFIAEELGISLSNIQVTIAASIPTWTIKQPEVFLELNKFTKQKNVPTHIPVHVSGRIGKLPSYTYLYRWVKVWEKDRMWSNILKNTPKRSSFRCRGLCNRASRLSDRGNKKNIFGLTIRLNSFEGKEIKITHLTVKYYAKWLLIAHIKKSIYIGCLATLELKITLKQT